jgi:hypothetical protein
MRAYEKWLGERQELAMLDVLRLMGLFDRPADAASVNALRATPAIPGLTDSLFRYERQKRWFGLSTSVKAEPISEREWQKTVSALRRIRLLAEASEQSPDTLDAHPLVREYFRQQLKREKLDAWRRGNNRIYEHLVVRRGPVDFGTKSLGAYGAELAALSHFFETPWQQPVKALLRFTWWLE